MEPYKPLSKIVTNKNQQVLYKILQGEITEIAIHQFGPGPTEDIILELARRLDEAGIVANT